MCFLDRFGHLSSEYLTWAYVSDRVVEILLLLRQAHLCFKDLFLLMRSCQKLEVRVWNIKKRETLRDSLPGALWHRGRCMTLGFPSPATFKLASVFLNQGLLGKMYSTTNLCASLVRRQHVLSHTVLNPLAGIRRDESGWIAASHQCRFIRLHPLQFP